MATKTKRAGAVAEEKAIKAREEERGPVPLAQIEMVSEELLDELGPAEYSATMNKFGNAIKKWRVGPEMASESWVGYYACEEELLKFRMARESVMLRDEYSAGPYFDRLFYCALLELDEARAEDKAKAEPEDQPDPEPGFEFIPELDLSLVVLNKHNPRKLKDNDPAVQELAESIRQNGVKVPIFVRPIADGKYEVAGGERRVRASWLLERQTIPAMARTMTDREFKELTVLENSHREDLTPLEEADAYALLIEEDWPIERVAEKMGVAPKTVRRRLTLRKLAKPWRDAYQRSGQPVPAKGKKAAAPPVDMSMWGAGHLEVISRLPEKLQAQAWPKQRYEQDRLANMTVPELAAYVLRFTRQIVQAKFDIKDPDLVPKAGSCTACPKQTARQGDLFDSGEKSTCLDTVCWAKKERAVVERTIAKLQEKGEAFYLFGPQYGWHDPGEKQYWKKKYAKRWKENDWNLTVDTKPGKGKTPAVMVGGDGLGKVYYVKERPAYNPTKSKKSTAAKKQQEPKAAQKFDAELRKVVDDIMAGKQPLLIKPEDLLVTALSLMVAVGEPFGTKTVHSGKKDWSTKGTVARVEKAHAEIAKWTPEQIAAGLFRGALYDFDMADGVYGLPLSFYEGIYIDVDSVAESCGIELSLPECAACNEPWSAITERGKKLLCQPCADKADVKKSPAKKKPAATKSKKKPAAKKKAKV